MISSCKDILEDEDMSAVWNGIVVKRPYGIYIVTTHDIISCLINGGRSLNNPKLAGNAVLEILKNIAASNKDGNKVPDEKKRDISRVLEELLTIFMPIFSRKDNGVAWDDRNEQLFCTLLPHTAQLTSSNINGNKKAHGKLTAVQQAQH